MPVMIRIKIKTLSFLEGKIVVFAYIFLYGTVRFPSGNPMALSSSMNITVKEAVTV